jgi:hypothetical protein
MVIFPDADMLVKEIESWNSFVEVLSKEDREYFNEMLEECYRYSSAFNQKAKPFPTEPLIMSILLHQHRLIKHLISKISINEGIEIAEKLNSSDDRK